MKTKTIMISMLMLLMLISASTIYAETAEIGTSTFTIPDGYTIVKNDTTQVILYNDEIAITMYEGPIINPEEAKYRRVNGGYNLLGEDNYYFDGAVINQQNYNLDGITTCVYTLSKNDKTYIITMNVDDYNEIPEYDDNPVTGIIDSLE